MNFKNLYNFQLMYFIYKCLSSCRELYRLSVRMTVCTFLTLKLNSWNS